MDVKGALVGVSGCLINFVFVNWGQSGARGRSPWPSIQVQLVAGTASIIVSAYRGGRVDKSIS